MEYSTKNKRNFCIIAHIDHGKSTLADRFLEITGTVEPKKMKEQFLDRLKVERERGITVKSQTVRMKYKGYELNLIDTPGHVDFSYEVSRAMAACEGAILLVDSTQGVQAQTLSHAYQAIDKGLEIIVSLNKIDLKTSDIERTKREIENIIGLPTDDAVPISAKTGQNVSVLLDKVIDKIPPPPEEKGPLAALIFDSWYDQYWGVVCLIRVFSGKIEKGDICRIFSTKKQYEVQRIGFLTPDPLDTQILTPGDVGFVIFGMKNIEEAKIGDTIELRDTPLKQPVQGLKDLKPLVFAGFYPQNPDDYERLKDALFKLKLNDSSLHIDYENSPALGPGFRIGFLGTLHMEVTAQRIEDEFSLGVIITFPQVAYKVSLRNGKEIIVKSPAELPPTEKIEKIKEPYILATIYTPKEYLGQIIKLCEERRGIQRDMKISDGKAVVKYSLPLSSSIFGFNDSLKSCSKGYASWDWEPEDWHENDIVKLDILLNGKRVDELSIIISKDESIRKAREVVAKLREIIPRQLFEVNIQAAVGSRILAKETVKPFRRDVIAKCYGGDITRKMKLLEKQKEGKKKLKSIGDVEVPQNAFIEIFKIK